MKGGLIVVTAFWAFYRFALNERTQEARSCLGYGRLERNTMDIEYVVRTSLEAEDQRARAHN